MNKLRVFALFVAVLMIFSADGIGPPVPSADGEIFLYRPVEKVKPGHFPLNQGQYGTCVAFGHAGGVDIGNAIKVITGKSRKFVPSSPDAIYAGARNEAFGRSCKSYGQGANGYGAVAWLTKKGGILYQQDYPSFKHDLTKYDISRCRDWGYIGNGGVADSIDGPFDQEAAKDQIYAAKVTSIAELDAALDRCCPVTICSNIGFSSPRDKDGFCRPSGSWSHCMLICARRNGGRKGYLVQNSWSDYIKGDGSSSTNKYQDQPDGSFYIEPNVALAILRQGDSWALSTDPKFSEVKAEPWMLDAAARPPANDPIPDPISMEQPTKPSDLFVDFVKPTADDFANLNGIKQPEPVATVAAAKPVARAASACGPNGCSTVMRRRWFR
jgi:hypothetical protein